MISNQSFTAGIRLVRNAALIVVGFLLTTSLAHAAPITITASSLMCPHPGNAKGCLHMNADINNGGGTDDTAVIQQALNDIGNNSGGGTLEFDVNNKYSLISAVLTNINNSLTGKLQTTALEVTSSTTIKFDYPTTSGVYLADHSNVAMLGNDIEGDPNNASMQSGITVNGGVWNGNVDNQDGVEFGGNYGDGMLVVGFWFSGIKNLTIQNATIRNSDQFSMVFGVASNVNILNSTSTWDHPFMYQDSIHIWGPLNGLTVSNFSSNGGDDVIALCNLGTDGEYVHLKTSYLSYRFPPLVADITNATFDGVKFNSSHNGIRFITNNDGGLIPTFDYITFRNFSGNITDTAMNGGGPILGTIHANTVSFDGWNVTGQNGINLPAGMNIQTLTLNNIIASAPISVVAATYAGNYFTSIYNPGTAYVFNGTDCNSSTINGDATFNDTACNTGTVNGNATFNLYSVNKGTINGGATFKNLSGNSGIITGDATFSVASHNDSSGVVRGNVTFSDDAFSGGVVMGTTIFTRASGGVLDFANGDYWAGKYNNGMVGSDGLPIKLWVFNGNSYSSSTATIPGDAIFNDSSSNCGTIIGSATFNGTSQNTCGAIYGSILFDDSASNNFNIIGDAVFKGSSVNFSTISGNATFDERSTNNGTISGNAIFVNDTSQNNGVVSGHAIRIYNSNIATSQDFTSNGPWSVIANGVNVDITYATHDLSTKFYTTNGGSFTPTPSGVVTVSLASVSLSDPTSLASSSLTLNATASSTGGSPFMYERGFVYGTTTAFGATSTETGSFGTGSFSANVTGLSCGITYHYASYAINLAGTRYSVPGTFNLVCPVSQASSGTIGGIVSGLSGTLVLQNNGGYDLRLSSNGLFTFANPVQFNSSYRVSVRTQPQGQYCSISFGSGMITSGNITSVSVTCGNSQYAPLAGYSGSISLGGSSASASILKTFGLTPQSVLGCPSGYICKPIASTTLSSFIAASTTDIVRLLKSGNCAGIVFNRHLTGGSVGTDVKCLQTIELILKNILTKLIANEASHRESQKKARRRYCVGGCFQTV